MNDVALKNIMAEPIQRNKVEFWAATAIYVFSLFSLSIEYSPNASDFRKANLVFHYYGHFFWPQLARFTLIYLAFLLLNFKVAPGLLRKEAVWLNVLLLMAAFVAVGLATGVLDTYYKAYML